MNNKQKNIVDCLDKGFVRLVDSMGGDNAIVQAARVAMGKVQVRFLKIEG